MAAKSQIVVDVDSAEFVAFAEKFNKYATLLATMPDQWKAIEKTTQRSKTNFEATADAVAAGASAALSSLSSTATTDLSGTHGPAGHQRGSFGYRGGGGTASPISGAQRTANAQECWNHWKARGYSDDAAAAMLAMERGESDFNPNAVGDHRKSKGSFQWDATRRAAIRAATGIDVASASHADQLRAEDWGSQHGDAGAQAFRRTLMAPGSIESYVASGVNDFERSKYRASDINKRLPMARSAISQYSKKPTVNVRNTPGGNIVNGANAAAAGSP